MRSDQSAARYSTMASWTIQNTICICDPNLWFFCLHLPDLTYSPFFPHCGGLLNNPETCPRVSCLRALDSLSSLPPTILGLNPGLLRCRQTLYQATSKGHQGFNLPPLVAIAAILFKFIHWCRAGRWLLCDTVILPKKFRILPKKQGNSIPSDFCDSHQGGRVTWSMSLPSLFLISSLHLSLPSLPHNNLVLTGQFFPLYISFQKYISSAPFPAAMMTQRLQRKARWLSEKGVKSNLPCT